MKQRTTEKWLNEPVKNGFKGLSRTRKGNGGRAVGSASSLRLLQKEINGGLADSGVDGSPKWRRPVGHCKGNLSRRSTLKRRTGEGGSKVNIQN
jgi:hypothetical protein